MGAFFLYQKGKPLLIDDVERIFSRKSFLDPRLFDLGDWSLLLYRKQLITEPNYYIAEDGSSVFCCGTIVYKKLGYSDSLKQLLADFSNKNIDQDVLIGNFCVLIFDGLKLFMMTDQLNVQHVFFNEQRSCFSSSFLAILAASPQPLSLNRMAVNEKITTGHIISPETLVEEIYKLNDNIKSSFFQNHDITFICYSPLTVQQNYHKEGMKKSIQRQIVVLKEYFQSIDNLNIEFGAELGLSSGYDCRLILALSRFLSKPISLHTHNTKGVHDYEVCIAKKIAQLKKIQLTVVPTKVLGEHDDERLEEILYDNLYYFDSRSEYSIGAFSEIYTNKYRKLTLADNRLTLNGLGGEIFRNSYFTPQREFRWSDWMNNHVFYPSVSETLGKGKIYSIILNRIIAKMENILKFKVPDRSNLFFAHLYYGLIRMPECAGNVHNAFNQVSFFLTPFIDLHVIKEGLAAIPYIGCCGRYEAAMINELDPELASVISHYGFSFNRISTKHMAICKLKGLLPLRLLYWRIHLSHILANKNRDYQNFIEFSSRSKTMREIKDAFLEAMPNVNWNIAGRHYAQRRIIVSLGSFFREFAYKIHY